MKLKKDYLSLVFLTTLLIFVFPMTVGARGDYLVLEEWELEGEMTIERAQEIDKNIDQIMEEELEQIKRLIEKDKPDFAFVKMLRLTLFLNAGAAKLPSIIGKLEKWIKEFISVLSSLAKKMGADGFSISAGSTGVSVGLSFTIP